MGNKHVTRNKAQYNKNKDINHSLFEHSRHFRRRNNILLLGYEGSGKSTIIKHLKIVEKNECFRTEELSLFQTEILSICMSQMCILLSVVESQQVRLSTRSQAASTKFLQHVGEGIQWDNEMGSLIKILWSDRDIKKTYVMNLKKFNHKDTNYFFDEIERISQEDYQPNTRDVLCARIHSNGTEEVETKYLNLDTFVFVDVGDQCSEKRKWLHFFDSATAVVFCVAINEYDQMLPEDRTRNLLSEALVLFEEISNSNFFANSCLFLLFTKMDLFKEKIEKVPLNVWMPSYKGDNIEDAIQFIKHQFINVTIHKMYIYFACALDTHCLEIIFRDILDGIRHEEIGKILEKAGEI